MKIASWNVNSLNVRLPHVLRWLDKENPDVLGLQELKIPDDRFPFEAFAEKGYHAVANGQRTYNGVAIISKAEPTDVVKDIPGLDDEQRRIIAATIDGVRVINLYVVNGQEPGSEKFAYKKHWLEKVTEFVAAELEKHTYLVVMGDFNIAPDDRDVFDPEECRGQIHCTEEERGWLKKLLDLGLVDTFRALNDEPGHFSWWDYRAAAFRRKRGLRIDLILASEALAKKLTAAWIDVEPRTWERPSDHAPVIAEFDL